MPLDAPSTTPTRRRVKYRPKDPSVLKAKRKALDMTQVAVAEVAGVSHSMIHLVEYGESDASYEVAAGIAEALNEPLTDLFQARQDD
jgi:transcriptional regulator with XRE-family HTH domain